MFSDDFCFLVPLKVLLLPSSNHSQNNLQLDHRFHQGMTPYSHKDVLSRHIIREIHQDRSERLFTSV